jgi:hypothetical protein
MASRGKPTEGRRLVPRLYLVTPEESAGAGDMLAQTIGAADFAAVVLRLPPALEYAKLDRVKALGPGTTEMPSLRYVREPTVPISAEWKR